MTTDVPPTLETLTGALRQFTGTETWYRHGMICRGLYTDGVHYLAEKADASWLVDIVTIAQHCKPRVRADGVQVWRLKRTKGKNSAVVTCDDGHGRNVYRQCIPCTDVPLDMVTLSCVKDDAHWVMMLPSEN